MTSSPTPGSTTYGVIGVGSLASAIVTGLCLDDPPAIVLSPRSAAASAALAERHPTVTVAADNQAVVDAADVVLVSVLPAQAEEVLAPLTFRADQAVVSVLAGVALAEVARMVTPVTRVACADPMPSAAVGRGATPVYPPLPEAVALFERVGDVVAVDDETAYEALIVPSATIAAHLDHLAALAGWVAERGVPDAEARSYVAALYAGVADRLAHDPDFGGLAAEAATPGGLNELFARRLREAGVPETVRSGLDAVSTRLAQT